MGVYHTSFIYFNLNVDLSFKFFFTHSKSSSYRTNSILRTAVYLMKLVLNLYINIMCLHRITIKKKIYINIIGHSVYTNIVCCVTWGRDYRFGRESVHLTATVVCVRKVETAVVQLRVFRIVLNNFSPRMQPGAEI